MSTIIWECHAAKHVAHKRTMAGVSERCGGFMTDGYRVECERMPPTPTGPAWGWKMTLTVPDEEAQALVDLVQSNGFQCHVVDAPHQERASGPLDPVTGAPEAARVLWHLDSVRRMLKNAQYEPGDYAQLIQTEVLLVDTLRRWERDAGVEARLGEMAEPVRLPELENGNPGEASDHQHDIDKLQKLLGKPGPVDRAVDALNSMLALDHDAMLKLLEYRVHCNDALADHPTCQVGDAMGRWAVGLLGILNGIFGKDERGWGYIAAELDNGKLVRFTRTPQAAAPSATSDASGPASGADEARGDTPANYPLAAAVELAIVAHQAYHRAQPRTATSAAVGDLDNALDGQLQSGWQDKLRAQAARVRQIGRPPDAELPPWEHMPLRAVPELVEQWRKELEEASTPSTEGHRRMLLVARRMWDEIAQRDSSTRPVVAIHGHGGKTRVVRGGAK